MTKHSPSNFITDGLNEAYEKLLMLSIKEAKLLKATTGPALHKIIDQVSQKASEFSELSAIEVQKISEYLKRDLHDAATYMAENKAEFKQWLAIDTELIEEYLYEHFSQAADQTTVELNKLKMNAGTAEYRTGEITGPGVLVCDKCGEQLHFVKAGHIPPCAKCHDTHFHRLLCE
jgi:hypothetical protein